MGTIKDTHTTKVIFKFITSEPTEADEQPTKEVIAIFPEFEESPNCFLSYMHIGQHSGCHEIGLRVYPDADFKAYESLYFELESIGYNLDVLNDDFLKNVDYFGILQLCPSEVQNIVGKYAEKENSYEDCKKFKSELNAVGWTCGYFLDAELFGLRKMTSEEIEKLTACVCKNLTESDRNKLVSESLTSNK